MERGLGGGDDPNHHLDNRDDRQGCGKSETVLQQGWRLLLDAHRTHRWQSRDVSNWTVPAPNGNKKSCLVKVILYDSSGGQVGADTSDDPFTIEVVELTYPNGGANAYPGSDGGHHLGYQQYHQVCEQSEVILHKRWRDLDFH